jgi:hypothetical protein
MSRASALLGVLFAMATLTAGCVVKTNQEWIRDAASRDLQCPSGQVTVHHYTDTPDRKGATGCGKTAKFNRVCGQDGYCRWKIEGPTEPKPY